MLRLPSGHSLSVIDLPGVYSLHPATPDEEVTLEVIEGRRTGEASVDTCGRGRCHQPAHELRLVLELGRLGPAP